MFRAMESDPLLGGRIPRSNDDQLNGFVPPPSILERMENGRPSKSFYQSKSYMSSSAFNTLAEEVTRQQGARLMKSRSLSIDNDLAPSLLNPDIAQSEGRRAMYGALPFLGVHGMQHRETEVHSSITLFTISVACYGPPFCEPIYSHFA